jgi:hypothetical protein
MSSFRALHRTALGAAALAVLAVATHGCSSATRERRNAMQAAAAITSGTDDKSDKKKPKLEEVKPDTGDLAGGTQVVLEGKRFLKADAGRTFVLFGTSAVEVTPASDEEIWVVAPPAVAAGPVDVMVSNDHGSDVLAAAFTYELERKTKPKLEEVSPGRGPLTGGTPVVLEGERFLEPGAGQTIVLFDAERVVVTPVADDRIEVLAPAGLRPGKVQVRVLNDHGVDALDEAFEYEAGPTSDTLSFSPGVGRHEDGVGTRITLTASFAVTASATVTFDALVAPVVAAVTSHTLVVEVPQRLRAGLVSVTLADGAGRATQAGFLVQGDLAYGDLLVNEFLPDATALDSNGDGVVNEDGDEFVEVVNVRGEPIDLTGLEVLDATGQVRHRFPNPTTLPTGGALVVFGGGTPMGFAGAHESGQAQAATSGQLSLSNGGDRIELRTHAGRVLFRVEYDDSRPDTSYNRKTDGDRTDADPALLDDKFKRHDRVDRARGVITPGRRATGAAF